MTAGFDPLLDEGERYGQRLAAGGVQVTHLTNPALLHGFIDIVGSIPAAALARDRIVSAVNELLDGLVVDNR